MASCEFIAGYDITVGQKPLILKCGNAAKWRKSDYIFGGGIYGCDNCWQRWCASHGLEEESK